MKAFHLSTWKTFMGVLLAYPTVASAAPLGFDCDVPPDHYSSVSQDASGQMTISGTVEPVQMRSGSNLPVAGVRFTSPDGKSSTGFQLVADSPRARQFSIVLNTRRGDDLRSNTVGQVGIGGAIPFSFTLSDSGKATLLVSGTIFNTDFVPMPSGTEMAFCSTGQFKFSNLIFSTAGEPTTPTPK
jgi:hypothetical protein